VIAYSFPFFCSPYLTFLSPVVSFIFHLLREFLLLKRSTCVYSRCQQASTNCPHTDIDTTLRHHLPQLLTRLLPDCYAFCHQKRVIATCCLPFSATSAFSHCCQTLFHQEFSCEFGSLMRHLHSVSYNVPNSNPNPDSKQGFSVTGNLIFMHDGALCHKCCSVTEFLDARGIERLPWLGNSPGKNPSESLLSILKSEMQQKTIKNKRQLIEELISAWRREDSVRNACNELVHSMPARAAALNNAKGSFIRYKTHTMLHFNVLLCYFYHYTGFI